MTVTAIAQKEDGVPVTEDGIPSNASVPADILSEVNEQMGELLAATDRLAAKMVTNSNATKQSKALELSDLRKFVEDAEGERAQKVERADLAALPASVDEKTIIFTEWDELVLHGNVEQVLLGETQAAAAGQSTDARMEALESLNMTLEEASSALSAAGVTMREDFVDFAEMCAVKRVRLCILSRGLKPLIRLLLREQGLGHVTVLANDMIAQSGQGWKVSLNADGWKGEAMRRELQTARKAALETVLQIGNSACDFPVATGGNVTALITPVGSDLARICAQSGVRHREFAGWAPLTAFVMGTGPMSAMPIADGTDLADLD